MNQELLELINPLWWHKYRDTAYREFFIEYEDEVSATLEGFLASGVLVSYTAGNISGIICNTITLDSFLSRNTIEDLQSLIRKFSIKKFSIIINTSSSLEIKYMITVVFGKQDMRARFVIHSKEDSDNIKAVSTEMEKLLSVVNSDIVVEWF